MFPSWSFVSGPRWDGSVVCVSALHAVVNGFVPGLGHTKDHHKNGTNCLPTWHAGVRVGVCGTVYWDSKDL